MNAPAPEPSAGRSAGDLRPGVGLLGVGGLVALGSGGAIYLGVRDRRAPQSDASA